MTSDIFKIANELRESKMTPWEKVEESKNDLRDELFNYKGIQSIGVRLENGESGPFEIVVGAICEKPRFIILPESVEGIKVIYKWEHK